MQRFPRADAGTRTPDPLLTMQKRRLTPAAAQSRLASGLTGSPHAETPRRMPLDISRSRPFRPQTDVLGSAWERSNLRLRPATSAMFGDRGGATGVGGDGAVASARPRSWARTDGELDGTLRARSSPEAQSLRSSRQRQPDCASAQSGHMFQVVGRTSEPRSASVIASVNPPHSRPTRSTRMRGALPMLMP